MQAAWYFIVQNIGSKDTEKMHWKAKTKVLTVTPWLFPDIHM